MPGLFCRSHAPLKAEEREEADQRDKSEDGGQVDHTIEAPDLGEDTSQAIAEQLAQTQEDGI